jgi:predicted HAD superfamily phosphohydrolase YqeG
VIEAFRSDVVRRGIKCVVFDMDKTLVALHSVRLHSFEPYSPASYADY